MNIFAYHPKAEVCALWLDDVRKNKMILESCQLMSTAMNVLYPGHGLDCYRTSHLNHPCAVWVREGAANFEWLLQYTKHLYKQRGLPHACASLFPSFEKFLKYNRHRFHGQRRTPFVNCARNTDLGLDFTHISNVFAAYRLYHKRRWESDKHNVTWNYGQKPSWA